MNPLLLTAGTALLSSKDGTKDTAFNALSTISAIGAGILTRSLVTKAWTKKTGQEPPNDPTAEDVSWKDAVSWAAAAGVAVGVGRVVGRRLAADIWARGTDEDDPRGAVLGEAQTADA